MRFEPNGQVFVNGHLVAEVTVVGVTDRDDLTRELTAHRCAAVIATRLTELIRYTEAPPPGKGPFTAQDRADFGAAMFAGLAGETGELTGRQSYRDGYRAGETLRALRDHIVAALPEDPQWMTQAEYEDRG